MNYSFLLILLFPIISTNELLYSSEESSSIFPLQLGKLYETNNTSTKACLFLFFDDLKLIDLHNIKVPYLGRNLSICPGEESALYLDTIKIDQFTFKVSENETISLHYNSEGQEQILDFECSQEEIIEDRKIKTEKACGYQHKIKIFLFKYNYVIGNMLFLSGIIILFYGSIYQRGTVIFSCIFLIFYLVELIFDLLRNNVLGVNRNTDIFYWGLLIIAVIIGPFIGIALTLNATLAKCFNGIFSGYLAFKMLIYYLICLRFSNPIGMTILGGFACHIVIAIVGGVVFYSCKHFKYILIISASVIGSYFIIEAFGLFIGGMPIEMYIALLSRYKDFDKANEYLNRGIVIFYIVLFVVLGLLGALFQVWKTKQIIIIEKPKKKEDKTLSIEQKSYQLLDSSNTKIE